MIQIRRCLIIRQVICSPIVTKISLGLFGSNATSNIFYLLMKFFRFSKEDYRKLIRDKQDVIIEELVRQNTNLNGECGTPAILSKNRWDSTKEVYLWAIRNRFCGILRKAKVGCWWFDYATKSGANLPANVQSWINFYFSSSKIRKWYEWREFYWCGNRKIWRIKNCIKLCFPWWLEVVSGFCW